MEWRKGRESDNVVQDSSGGFGRSGSGVRLPLGRFPLGWKGIVFLLLISFIFKINPIDLLQIASGLAPSNSSYTPNVAPVSANDPQIQFVKTILGSTEDVWGEYFNQMGSEYERPRLELFNGQTRSGCGAASESMGPFYCSADHMVYLDLSFFEQMKQEFNSTEDFARAYVIAHEVGHHVQNLLGTMDKLAARSGVQGAEGISVRIELQADCYAGVWANRSERQLNWLQDGDVESALRTAQAIGDDLLQKKSQGYAVPDSFTHGTSTQRVAWFKRGFDTGDIRQCDTF